MPGLPNKIRICGRGENRAAFRSGSSMAAREGPRSFDEVVGAPQARQATSRRDYFGTRTGRPGRYRQLEVFSSNSNPLVGRRGRPRVSGPGDQDRRGLRRIQVRLVEASVRMNFQVCPATIPGQQNGGAWEERSKSGRVKCKINSHFGRTVNGRWWTKSFRISSTMPDGNSSKRGSVAIKGSFSRLANATRRGARIARSRA